MKKNAHGICRFIWSGATVCQSCRNTLKMNIRLVAKLGVDTDEIWPSEVCRYMPIHILYPLPHCHKFHSLILSASWNALEKSPSSGSPGAASASASVSVSVSASASSSASSFTASAAASACAVASSTPFVISQPLKFKLDIPLKHNGAKPVRQRL